MLNSVKEKIVARVEAATSNGKVYIFLTGSGGYFSLLIFILFIISLSYANSLAYLCSFLFFSVIFVSCHITNFNLYGIDFFRLKLADYYFEEEEAMAFVGVKNSGTKSRYDIEVSIFNSSSSYVAEVLPGQSCELGLILPHKEVGLYEIERGNLNTSFPFGIFKSWKPFKCSSDYLVIPKPVEMPLPGSINSSSEKGILRSSLQKEEFLEHRKYNNESLQRIDWKLYAKRDQLYVKDFDSNIGTSFKFDESTVLGNRKEVLGILTGWVLRAEEMGARYSLNVNGRTIGLGSGRNQLLSCLKAISSKGEKR